MKPERLEDLLWQRIDETLGADDEAELERYLAGSVEAQKVHKELTGLNAALAAMPETPRPTGFREALDRRLSTARLTAGVNPNHRKVDHRAASQPWLVRLLPLAAGLLIGAAVVHLLHLGTTRTVGDANSWGSMGATSVQKAQSTVEVDLGADVGTVDARRDGNVLMVEPKLKESVALHLGIEAAGGDLLLIETSQTETSTCRLTTDRGRVDLWAEGPGQYRIVVQVTHRDTPVRLAVSVGGETVAEHWLETDIDEEHP